MVEFNLSEHDSLNRGFSANKISLLAAPVGYSGETRLTFENCAVWHHTSFMASRSRLAGFVTLYVAVLLVATLRAQNPAPPAEPPPEGPLHTLHVYMDLIQVPVLVLDSEQGRMKPIDPAKFLVSLDSGPTFHPRHVRQEGDDPITLGILLDPNGTGELMPRISDAISSLAPGLLHPRDHVTVFVLDCTLSRTLHDVPADPDKLKAGVDNALQNWFATRKIKHPPPCAKRVQLWDAMGFVINELGNFPGRRVLLAVTDGDDKGSHVKWNDLRAFAQQNGVAIFGYSPAASSSSRGGVSGSSTGRFNRPMSLPQFPASGGNAPENPFSAICQMSGGMIMAADSRYMPQELARFTTLVRERYILEFARARNDSPGEHSILVTINKNSTAYVRPAGVLIMLPDAALANDPDTIPRDSTDAPELGTRKPLKAPR